MRGRERAVLVTGGAGYVGAHACKALRQAGYTPVVYDNLSTGREAAVRWGPLVVGDTRDGPRVAEAIRSFGTEAVLHFAAASLVGESMRDPVAYFSNNVGGLLGVLEAMQASDCRTLVFSSTAAVYGHGEGRPLSEASQTRPINPYGRSKLMCENILADAAGAGVLRYVALRYFNAAGADPDGEIGEDREVETHLIPRAILAMQGRLSDFAVFGADFDTPDGTAVRDYVHVADLADAHVAALRALSDGAPSGVFNLGAGQGHSVGEVLREIERIGGGSLGAPEGPRRPGDPAVLIADATAAGTVLGFRPARSDLTSIVQSAWRWHQVSRRAEVA